MQYNEGIGKKGRPKARKGRKAGQANGEGSATQPSEWKTLQQGKGLDGEGKQMFTIAND